MTHRHENAVHVTSFAPVILVWQSVENHWHGQVNGFPAPKLGEKLSQESNIFGSIFGTQPQICTEYLRFTKINRNKRFKSHMGYMGLNMDPVEQAARTWVF